MRIAYLVQVSSPKKLSLVRRTFKRLYNADDVFLYTVDQVPSGTRQLVVY